MLPEGGHRHGDGKIGLAGSGRPDPQHDGVFPNGVDIFLLPECLGLDGLSLGRDADDVSAQLAQLVFLSLSGQPHHIVDPGRVDLLSLGGHLHERFQSARGQGHSLALPHDFDAAFPEGHVYVKGALERVKVLVNTAQHMGQLLQAVKGYNLFCEHSRSSPFIFPCMRCLQ